MNTLTVRRGFAMGMAILLSTTVAFPAQADPKFAQAQQQNAQALRQYSWKSRTEIRKGGETKNIQLALVCYDSYGTQHKTPIANSPQQQLPTRGLRGLIAQKKKESLMETLDSLAALARSYGELPADSMQGFMRTAAVTPEVGPQQRLVRITGNNVLQKGDSMTLWIDAVTRKQRRVEVYTTLDRQPVRIVSEFQDLPMGPTYMARSLVDHPSEQLTLITENFDYERAAR